MKNLEEKNNLIKNTVLNVASNFLKQETKINEKMDATLNKKFEKVDLNESKYVELLKFNILFYKTLSRNIEPLIGKWITDKYIPNIDELEKDLELITAKCRKYINKAMKEDIKLLKVDDLRSFLAYDKMEIYEKKRRLEKDYKVLNLYKDLLNILFRKISLDRDEFEFIYDLDYVEVKRDLKKEIIICVNKILSDPKSESVRDALDEEEFDYSEEMELVSEEKNDQFKNHSEHSGLNDVEVTYLTKLGGLSAIGVEKYINNEYKRILKLEDITNDEALGFGTEGIIDFAAGSIILEFLNKKNRDLIEGAMRLVAIGEFGEKNFNDYMKSIIKDETVINLEVWNEACKIIKKNFENITGSEIASKNVATFNDIDMDEYIYMIKNADKNKHFKDSFATREVVIAKDEIDKNKGMNDNISSDTHPEDTKVFKELELLKSMGEKDGENVERNEKHKFVELADSIEEKENHKESHKGDELENNGYVAGFEDLEKFDEEYKKNTSFGNSSNSEDEIMFEDIVINEQVSSNSKDEDGREEDGEALPKTRRVRDTIVGIAVVAVVVVMYFTTVKGSNRPDQSASNNTQTQSQNTNNNTNNSSKKAIDKKAAAEKKVKEAEAKKAKEMEALKDGGGEYYRVYAGAHNSEGSAKEAQDKFSSKGIDTKIVKSNGYFKLDAGDFDDYNEATERTSELSKKSIDTYIAKYDKYYDYKLEEFKKSAKKMSDEELKEEYNNLKDELKSKSGSSYREYSKNLDEIYDELQQ
ncbi:SPOR domain-containing protein [Metaclostridioides mangenotii]|uniref:SPOR domain-containing protein n=1 Tax=Metaclostridioides mangenotii TaxID=1540 RepID=UPI0028E537DA|nr:SPOR domain-containing protein [Clostridioides mangenotii]